MPLKDFLQQQSLPQVQPIQVNTTSSLGKFLSEKQNKIQQLEVKQVEPFKGEKTKPQKELTKWQWISKQLMKPVGTVAAETEALGKFIGTGQAYIPGKAGLDVLSGKRETSFSDVWRRNYIEPMKQYPNTEAAQKVGATLGFIFDLTDDPFNFVGGGLTKMGYLATTVSSLTKTGKKIAEGSKLWNKIKNAGYTVEELTLAGSKLEQAQKGQRALLTIAGKPILKGEKVYEVTKGLSSFLNKLPAWQGLKATFSTKTGIKEIDEMVDTFKNLGNYRKQQVMDKANEIQKDIIKLKPEELKMVAEAIERPEIRETIQNKNILKISDKLENLFTDMKITEKAKGVLKSELENYFPHIKIQGEGLKGTLNALFNPKTWSVKLPFSKERKIGGTVDEINQFFGKDFFQSNPAIAFAQRGLAGAKAVTAKEFLEEVGTKFFVTADKAPIRFLESTNPILKGLKAEPEVVKVVDQYIKGVQPEELKLIIRVFDKVQNWWKAQVLISPSYHLRNRVGDTWNNWLSGLKNPIQYDRARSIQKSLGNNKGLNNIVLITEAGEQLTKGQIADLAKRNGVLGRGWYGADITTALQDEVGGLWNKARKIKNWMPWKQENVLFKTNKAVGTALEDNGRLAHFIDKLEKGFSAKDAARSVKKFLFDYEDLTWAEKKIFKRVAPFYTWTRKNIPLQLENLIYQPEKYAALPKIIQQIESGSPEPKTEKYMNNYLKENIPIRIRQSEKGHSEYFMLGNWLPAAQAIDFLSQPLENIIYMVTPLAKTPYELWANKSTFFKNTLGESSKIENYYKQPTEFVGVTMRKKTAQLLRNIRILNDLNKLTKQGTSQDPADSLIVKLLNVFFGKAGTYDIKQSKYFYDKETQDRINELKASIKAGQKRGDKNYVNKLVEELKQFKKERYGK